MSLPTTKKDMIAVGPIRDVLVDFFERLGISNRLSTKGIDPALGKRFNDLTREWDLDLAPHHFQKFAALGLNMGTMAYRHTPIDVQMAISIYTTLGIMVDEDIMTIQTICEFPRRLFGGRVQPHPILARFAECLASMHEHFSPYSANAITTNTVDFVSAEMLVRGEGGPDVKGSAGSAYADYIRLKNGLGETYAAFVWPRAMFPETKRYVRTFPYISEFACYGNDLYSFYKEEIVGETENYVSQHAAARGQPSVKSLQDIADKLVEIDSRVREILGDGPEKKAWESFIIGYAEFHLHTPRYRLKEIIPEFCP
ncbi:Trichodiene synthase-domain-containing protein [Cristinia sonorae]|uniref:Trichodiene synthase-domain-containing protein n=1 Tax=Cristinia sonorae TaxID=1940300 RepID=A0A8K0UNX9_9AGAR|nr:Trichodiene synthase-domain-containing protein [Cristinia sonorae]